MMIKKHIIACLALFVFTIVCTAMILSHLPAAVIKMTAGPDLPGEINNQETTPTDRQISFANESVPSGDSKISYRLRKQLRAHQYERLQTTILHNKASKWFPVIEPILAEYGIPEDFKYITLVESGLKEGTSLRGASGYWQFMPGTARSYGLTVNKRIDERQNMRKSTVAACKYLKELYAELRSWTLAAAAYNVGDTKLKYQMASQKQRNYYKMRLNKETASYVYKLISMKEIIENPSAYGYRPRPELLARSAAEPSFRRSFSGINLIRPTEVWQN